MKRYITNFQKTKISAKMKILAIYVLLFASSSSHGKIYIHNGKPIRSMYGSFQYYGDLGVRMGDMTAKENIFGSYIKAILGFDKTGVSTKYNPSYTSDYIAGGVSIGTPLTNRFRVECEILYSNIEPDDSDFTDKPQARYLELQRDDIIDGALESGGGFGGKSEILKNKYAYSIGSVTNPNTGIMPNSGGLTVNDHLALKFRNLGFRSISIIANATIDIASIYKPLVPFISIGFGPTQNTFLNESSYGFAYQFKLGFRYHLAETISVHTALNYRSSFIREYKNIYPEIPIIEVQNNSSQSSNLSPKESVSGSNTTNFNVTYGVYGVMIGLLFEFP